MNSDNIFISGPSASSDGTPYGCFVKHCTITVHKIVTHHDASLGLHYARTLRWPVALVLIALLFVIALTEAWKR